MALGAVLFGAALLRLVPMLEYSQWGSDWGEYYHLLDGLVSTGSHPGENLGWGRAYVDFPGLIDLAGSISLVTGVGLEVTMSFILPGATALSCLLVACIVLRLGGGPWAALFSSASMAVMFPEVFYSSHPVPGTVGSIIFLTVLLVYLLGDVWGRRADHDVVRPSSLHLLFIVLVVSLTVTHHMALYFVLIITVASYLLRATLTRGSESRREAWGLFSIVTIYMSAFVFWIFLAPTFKDEVMPDLLGVGGGTIMVALAGGLPVLYYLNLALTRGPDWRLDFMYSTPTDLRRLLVAFLGLGLAVLLAVAVLGLPGTDIETGIDILPVTVPMLVLFCLMVGSLDIILRRHGGHVAVAWLAVLMVSFLLASATKSQVLLSYRHLPYIGAAVTVFLGIGLVHLRRMLLPEGRRWSRASVVAVTLLVVALAATAYPPKEVMGGFQEGTSEGELSSALWLRGGLPGAGADPGDPASGVVVADHRMSSMAFGLGGQMATWDTGGSLLHGRPGEGTWRNLESIPTPTGSRPVTAVLLSEDYRTGAALYQWETASPVDGEAWDKFFDPPFYAVYSGDGEWVMVVMPWGEG